jgi:integrase
MQQVLGAAPRWVRCPYTFSVDGERAIKADLSYTQKLVDVAARQHARRLGVKFGPAWTAHDLRRTARTHLSKLGVAPHIAERILGHTHADVAAVYDHHDYLPEMREALSKWSARLELLRIS